MTSARIRAKRAAKSLRPSLPRQIGANDNIETANDNAVQIKGVTLNTEQARRFRMAEANTASPEIESRRIGTAAMLVLEEEIDAALAEMRRRADEAEMVALETGRKSVIETSERLEHKGRKRIATRDGLETLLTATAITTTQHAAGLRFRTDYELLDPEKGLTPPALDQTRKIVHGGDGWAKKRLERELFVRDLEKMIQEEDRTCKGANGRSDVERVGRAVWALREIAGKGSNLSALCAGHETRSRTSRALQIALDCASIAYGLE